MNMPNIAVGCFPRNDILNVLFLRSQSFVSLPSLMFVSVAVIELHESNQKNCESGLFQFNTFPGYNYNSPILAEYLLNNVCIQCV